MSLGGGEWLTTYPCCFTPRNMFPSTHRMEGWLGSRVSLDDLEKRKNLLFMLGIELWITQAVPLSLYWLHYPSMMYSVSAIIPTVYPTTLFYLVYLVCYSGRDQFIVLSYVLEQHVLVYSALYRESTSIICICHSLLWVLLVSAFTIELLVDTYMSWVPLISYDLGNLAYRTVPYVTSHRGHCLLLIRISCITWRISKLLETLSFIRVT
jgi:hypothetical protein